MADQAITEPLGMVENIPIRTAGVKFEASFLILEVGNSYHMLLGRPWLRAAGAVHDWGTDELTTIKWGVKLPMGGSLFGHAKCQVSVKRSRTDSVSDSVSYITE